MAFPIAGESLASIPNPLILNRSGCAWLLSHGLLVAIGEGFARAVHCW